MKISQLIMSLATAGFIVMSGVGSAYAASGSMSADQKKQVEGVVRDYIIANPEVLMQSLQSYQQKQMDQARHTMEKTQQNSPKFADALFHQSGDPMAGNPKGKITVVEFFDYQCPHCVDMVPVMDALISSNPDVRVIYKEFPIRGPVSEFAAKAALAANEQGKYVEFHKALMSVKKQPLTQEAILDIAKSVGLDVEKLKVAMDGSNVAKQIKATYKLAQDLQLLGTPALFVGKSDVTKNSPPSAILFIPGQVTKEQLQDVVKKVS